MKTSQFNIENQLESVINLQLNSSLAAKDFERMLRVKWLQNALKTSDVDVYAALDYLLMSHYTKTKEESNNGGY